MYRCVQNIDRKYMNYKSPYAHVLFTKKGKDSLRNCIQSYFNNKFSSIIMVYVYVYCTCMYVHVYDEYTW